MNKKKVIIEGSNFRDIDGFYTDIDRILTKELTWRQDIISFLVPALSL